MTKTLEIKTDNNQRAKEFLDCLGNGKGSITYEDENPNGYEKEK